MKPLGSADGEVADFDRKADVQALVSAGKGEEKSPTVLFHVTKKRGGYLVLICCSIGYGAKPQSLYVPRMPGDTMATLETNEFLYEFAQRLGKVFVADRVYEHPSSGWTAL